MNVGMRPNLAGLLSRRLLTAVMICLVGPAHAAPTLAPEAGSSLSRPGDTSLGGTQEQVTVWGYRRKFSAAPTSGNQLAEPDNRTGFGPGTRIGRATIEGGLIHGTISDGVSAGLAVPIVGVKGLDFTASLAGTRDGLSPSNTVGAASAVVGLRLRW